MHGTLTRTLMEDTIPADVRDLRFKVPLEIEKKYPTLQNAEFVQISSLQNLNAPEFAFRTLVDYYIF